MQIVAHFNDSMQKRGEKNILMILYANESISHWHMLHMSKKKVVYQTETQGAQIKMHVKSVQSCWGCAGHSGWILCSQRFSLRLPVQSWRFGRRGGGIFFSSCGDGGLICSLNYFYCMCKKKTTTTKKGNPRWMQKHYFENRARSDRTFHSCDDGELNFTVHLEHFLKHKSIEGCGSFSFMKSWVYFLFLFLFICFWPSVVLWQWPVFHCSFAWHLSDTFKIRHTC